MNFFLGGANIQICSEKIRLKCPRIRSPWAPTTNNMLCVWLAVTKFACGELYCGEQRGISRYFS